MQQLWDAAVISVFVTNVPQVYVSKPGVKAVIYPGGLSPMLREFSGQVGTFTGKRVSDDLCPTSEPASCRRIDL